MHITPVCRYTVSITVQLKFIDGSTCSGTLEDDDGWLNKIKMVEFINIVVDFIKIAIDFNINNPTVDNEFIEIISL